MKRERGIHPSSLLAGGVHDHHPEPKPRPRVLPEPHLEDMGRDWFKVFGASHGPFDVHGRVQAERALEAVVAERKAEAEMPGTTRLDREYLAYVKRETEFGRSPLDLESWLRRVMKDVY